MSFRRLAGVFVGMAFIVCAGCTPGEEPHQDVVLKFAAAVGNEAARCGQTYSGLGTADTGGEIMDLRLYVSNIRLINAEGAEVPVELEQDGKWQVENVALLDFEDATGRCSDGGTTDVRGEVTGTVHEGSYEGIVFDVAVPFDLNHDDLASAPSPLNVSAMYWGWAVGYKFVRIDFLTENDLTWSVHVGSTGCESDGPSDPPSVECGKPNRIQVRFDSFDPEHDIIQLDLAALFANTDLTQDTPDSSAGCQSFPDDVDDCTPLFPTLGIDFETGACTDDCANQTTFTLRNIESSDTAKAAAIARGTTLYFLSTTTHGGQVTSCSTCHGADGSGGVGPDIRPSIAGHLKLHAHDDGPHPEGVKFSSLTAADFDDLGAYLTSICEADPNCEPASVDHDHGDHPH